MAGSTVHNGVASGTIASGGGASGPGTQALLTLQTSPAPVHGVVLSQYSELVVWQPALAATRAVNVANRKFFIGILAVRA